MCLHLQNKELKREFRSNMSALQRYNCITPIDIYEPRGIHCDFFSLKFSF